MYLLLLGDLTQHRDAKTSRLSALTAPCPAPPRTRVDHALIKVLSRGAFKRVIGVNSRELTGPDVPLHLYSCTLGERSPTYACFLPTQYTLPGLFKSLTVWMVAHAMRARARLRRTV